MMKETRVQKVHEWFCLGMLLILMLGTMSCRHLGGIPENEGPGGNIMGSTSGPQGKGTDVTGLLANPLSCLCTTLGNKYYAASSDGKILKSTDGLTFQVLNDTAYNVHAVYCDRQSTTQTVVWFVGDKGLILKFDGTNLTDQTNAAITANLYGIFGTDTSNIYAVGAWGTIIHWDGVAWTSQVSTTTQDLFGIGGPNNTQTLVVGSNRTVLRQDFSSGWVPVSSMPSDVWEDTGLNAVWVDPLSRKIFVVGKAGTIMQGTPNGASWQKQVSGTSRDLWSVHGLSDTNVLAVGEKGQVLSFNGASWTRQPNPVEGDNVVLRGVWMLSDTLMYAVGDITESSDVSGTILKWTTAGWSRLL